MPPEQPPRTVAVARPGGRRGLVTASGLLVLGLIVWLGFRISSAEPAGNPSALRVAVMPFNIAGDSTLTFLRDGLVDLLSADLDGVGAFTAVDPHALLSRVRAAPESPPRTLATQAGADRFIVGNVIGVGDSVLRVSC